jgi:hypothetical protein
MIDAAWLASLRYDEELGATGEKGIALSAMLIGGSAGRVRLLVWPLVLEVNASDLIKIEELTLPPEDRRSGAIPVEVVLRVGTPVLAIHPAETLPAAAVGASIPFALATRPAALMLPPSPNYTTALDDYIRRHGLEPAP